MKRESPTTLVENRIRELESQYDYHITGIRSAFNRLGPHLKPSSLLESSVNNIVKSKGIWSSAILSTLGIGAGLVAKKIFVHRSKSLLKKIAGTGLQFLITAVFAKGIRRRK